MNASAETVLRITSRGAEEMAVLLYKMLKNIAAKGNKSKGQVRLANIIKSSKKLYIYKIDDKNLKQFCTETKSTITYTVLRDRKTRMGTRRVLPLHRPCGRPVDTRICGPIQRYSDRGTQPFDLHLRIYLCDRAHPSRLRHRSARYVVQVSRFLAES